MTIAEKTWVWDPTNELRPREELEQLQAERLQRLVSRAHARIPHYRQLYDEQGIDPATIRGLDDVRRLPFISKYDFRAAYPYGLLGVDPEDVVRLHASSGTTGKPITGCYTANDMELWTECMARALRAGGTSKQDVAQNAYGYGLFTGGLGFHYGAERVGAIVVPTSGGQSKRQLLFMTDLGTTVLLATPSYALALVETAEAMGIDVKGQLKVRVGFFGAEPWTEAMRDELERRWGILALDHYGLTELMGPGVGFECPYKGGNHINEDHFLMEIIDPETGEPLPDGELGELVLTSLSREATPAIRFRTRDRTRIIAEPCACGRSFRKIAKLLGRTDDMLIIRGVNVFPSDLEAILLGVPGLVPQYVIVADRQADRMDELEVRIEASEELWARGEEAVRAIEARATRDIKDRLSITTRVNVMPPHLLERSEGKAKRVVDKRDLT